MSGTAAALNPSQQRTLVLHPTELPPETEEESTVNSATLLSTIYKQAILNASTLGGTMSGTTPSNRSHMYSLGRLSSYAVQESPTSVTTSPSGATSTTTPTVQSSFGTVAVKRGSQEEDKPTTGFARPSTGGFQAAFHAAPYDRVGSNQRGLLELLKLRGDVASVRSKLKGPPIYQELKPRGASQSRVELNGEAASLVGSPRSSSSVQLHSSDWESTSPPATILKAQPSSSNVLPSNQQEAIKQQVERRSVAREHSEGELQDEMAMQSCDAVGLTPVLATAMPTGRYLVLNMLTTWGDNHEVGLCGIECFNEKGERVVPSPSSKADPRRDDERWRKTSSPPHNGSPTKADPSLPSAQDVSIEKDVVSISTASADGSVRMLVEYSATPEEMSLLPRSPTGGSEDPVTKLQSNPRRQIASVMDGVVNTHDEAHMLVIPYTPGHHHLLCFVFAHPVTLSMVRIHNYCAKGRVQTFKGVRIAELTMDDSVVFRGEVQRHSGEIVPEEAVGLQNCENVLFTEDAAVLHRIMTVTTTRTEAAATTTTTDDSDKFFVSTAAANTTTPRPSTRVVVRSQQCNYSDDMGNEGGGSTRRSGADWLSSTAPPGALHVKELENQMTFSSDGSVHGIGTRSSSRLTGMARPSTTLSTVHATSPNGEAMTTTAMPMEEPRSQTKVAVYPSRCPKQVRSVCFMLLATWGDPQTIGLSGLRFRDASGNLIRQGIANCFVQYPPAFAEDVSVPTDEIERQMSYLFDENANTACTLPFAPAVQLVIVFDAPIPSLGFLEVANYSVGEKTFCGVKEVRLFLAEGEKTTANDDGRAQQEAEAKRFRSLWTFASSSESREALKKGHVVEVTPPDGVSLRKAPAHLSVPRFQTYDLSLQGGAAGETDAWGDTVGPDTTIGIGPGTGGSSEMSGVRHGAVGGYFATSFANSLNASMNIRAAMAMKRARMVLRDRPEWLLEYQPYITPLLPVGYVCKVRLHICARSVGVSSEDHRTPYISSSQALKSYLASWVVKPFRSCVFVNESGELIRPMNGTNMPTNVSEVVDEPYCIPMVVESVVSSVPVEDGVPYQNQLPLQVLVDLVFVADVPFCMAVLCLNSPLVMEGSSAWVKRLQVSMDDAMVYDSGEAVISLDPRGNSSVNGFPLCVSSIRPYVLFTLDANMLAEVREKIQENP